jgi:hypothetical protein
VEFLTIDFEVEATDFPAPPDGGPGADEVAGFDPYIARSGRPIIRDRNQSNPYDPPVELARAAATVTWELRFRPTTEGMYDIEIVAEDRAGNISEPVPLRVYWDKTPPSTNITSKPRSRESSTQAAFTWRRGGTRILPAKYSTCLQGWFGGWAVPPGYPGFTPFFATEGTTYSDLLPGGTYRFTVLSIDDAGNIETSVGPNNQYQWTVGDPVPDTVITSGPPRITADTTAVFTFREIPADNEVDFQWRVLNSGSSAWIDVQPVDLAQRTVRIVPLGDPAELRAVSYVFQVRAWKDYNEDNILDPLTEADPTPATYSWTVVPPARADDPGAPVLPASPEIPGDVQQTILRTYGPGQYVDAPGEQPVKYYREQAK